MGKPGNEALQTLQQSKNTLLLIVGLEVVGCFEVGSVGIVCDSVWQFVSALQ